MALTIKLNFDDCYPLKTDSITFSTFNTVLQDGEIVPMGIFISDEAHPLLPSVYNLAFGPIDQNNQIDDKAKLRHQDHSKLFSTIVLCGLTFLANNKDKFLGIDGSNNARAYMYYRCIQNNFEYLNQFINIYGVNYYIRVLRKPDEKDVLHPIDGEDVLAIPQLIKKEPLLKYEKLYNYFIFNIKG